MNLSFIALFLIIIAKISKEFWDCRACHWDCRASLAM